jgi:ubiquitin carboxyl-terminal hydrolase 7
MANGKKKKKKKNSNICLKILNIGLVRFKFDDDRVIPCTMKEVLEENFGGEQLGLPNIRPNARPINRFTNAYMLVYIRECMLDQVLAPVTETDIPRHLAERLENEARIRELRRKEKEEQHLFTKAFIADDDTFRANTGFDFANFEEKEAAENRIMVHKVRKDQTFGGFKEEIAAIIGLPPREFRFWLMVNRQNRTVRIDVPIPMEEHNSSMYCFVRVLSLSNIYNSN